MTAVTKEQTAALRAFLIGDADDWTRLNAQLIESNALEGYGEFVYAAFVTAARQRFPAPWTPTDIIRYVASVRAQISDEPDAIDPTAAEGLLRRALGDQIPNDLDEETKARAQILLLGSLVDDEHYDDARLDEFLDAARALAESW